MSDHENVYAYLDTNALLEYRHPRDNDWKTLTGEARLTLVLTDVAINELQRIKDAAGRDYPKKKRQRAGELLKSLERDLFSTHSGGTPLVRLQNGVDLAFEAAAIPELLFKQHQLDPTTGDDRLVAYVLRALETHGRVCLIGNDAGPRWKARAKGVRTFDLPDEWRVSEEPDPRDIELRELRRYRDLNESRTPRLSLRISAEGTILHCEIPRRIRSVSDATRMEVERLRAKYTVPDPNAMSGDGPMVVLGSTRRIYGGRYADVLASFLEEVADRLPEAIERRKLLDRYLLLNGLAIQNAGAVPAQAVRAVIHAPDKVTFSLDLPERDYSPPVEPPQRPGESTDERLRSSIKRWSRAQAAPIYLALDNPWTLVGEGCRSASIGLGTVRHAFQNEPMAPIYLLLPDDEDVKSFSLEYELHAHNAVEPARGKLHIHIAESSVSSPVNLVEREADG